MKAFGISGLVLVALVLSTGVASAQDTTPAVGIMAGFNQSYFAVSPAGETNAKQGLFLGGFAVFLRDKFVKIQPEIQFSQRRVGVDYGDANTIYSTNYMNLGLLARMKLFKGLYSTQGVQFSFPVSSTITIAGTDADNKDNIADDISIVIGVGHQFGRIGIEGRFDSGFKAVEEVPISFIKRNRAFTFVGIVGF